MKESTLQAKQQIVAGVQEQFSGAHSLVFVNYRGLTVAEDTAFRAKIRESGAQYKVIKNTVIKRATETLGVTGLDEILEGPTAVAYSSDPVTAAKVVDDFLSTIKRDDKSKLPSIKGGVYEGKAIDAEVVKKLAKTPSREQSIARIMGSLNSPISSFVRALNEIRKKKEEATA